MLWSVSVEVVLFYCLVECCHVAIPQFVYPFSCWGHLSCFWSGDFMNKATANILVWGFLWTYILILLEKSLGCGIKRSVQFCHSVMSNSLQPHRLQHARFPCPSPTPKACLNSCSSHRGCHSTISSSVIPFSSCLQSFPPSGSFQMSQFFTVGGQSIGVSASASVLPMNIQDWFPLGLTGCISLQSKGLSRVFSNITA